MIKWFFVFPILLIFLTDACLKTQSSSPIVCPCLASSVSLTSDGTSSSFAPTGNVTGVDSNNCPTSYNITCTPQTSGDTVSLLFQDGISGATSGSVVLVCTNGNWLYNTTSGSTLVVSASCLEI